MRRSIVDFRTINLSLGLPQCFLPPFYTRKEEEICNVAPPLPPPSPSSPLVAVGQGGPFQAPVGRAAAAARDGRDRPAIFFPQIFSRPRVFRTFFPLLLWWPKNVSLFPHPSYLEKKIRVCPITTNQFLLPSSYTYASLFLSVKISPVCPKRFF